MKKSDVKILSSELAQVVRCKRKDGSEYLIIHPAQIDHALQSYYWGNAEAQTFELSPPKRKKKTK